MSAVTAMATAPMSAGPTLALAAAPHVVPTSGDIVATLGQCGVDGSIGDLTTPAGALVDMLGADANTDIGDVGHVDAAAFNAAVALLELVVTAATSSAAEVKRPLSLVQRGTVRRFGQTCRIYAGTEQAPSAIAAAPPAASVPPVSAVAERKVSLAHLVNQADTTEVSIVDKAVVLKGYARYQTLFGLGKRPHPD
jgi:hypothetical protein